MKRLLAALAVLAALVLAGTAASSTTPEPSFNRTIYIVNHSTVYTAAQLNDELPALQAGVGDFEKYWGGSIRLATSDSCPYRAWCTTISDNAPACSCLGYHDIKNGVPYANVYTDPAYTTSVTFTHEVFEMAADWRVHRADLVDHTFYLVEVGDPVEDDSYAFKLPSASGKPVAISDFVTDLWYSPNLKAGKFDWANHVHHSLQILNNGYVSWWDGAKWQQTMNRNGRLVTGHEPIIDR